MDSELLIALIVLWCSTTAALVIFLRMWFQNGGEVFHPHSVDVEHRHERFLVVSSHTVCKHDCLVVSISAFVAPRGSSSSKQFTVICVMISVAGFLGSSRWYFMGDATALQAALSLVGFASLMLVAAFELDVVPERFLEYKLLVTAYLIEQLEMTSCFDFELKPSSEKFRDFIRKSKEIYYLFDEDKYLSSAKSRHGPGTKWIYFSIWEGMHMVGAVFYVFFVTAAILLNEIAEQRVAWITGCFFVFFCFMGYLTGKYAPLIGFFKGWVLLWNPFLKEPQFLDKLKQAVKAYRISSSPSKLWITQSEAELDMSFGESSSVSASGKVKKRIKRKNSSSELEVLVPSSPSSKSRSVRIIPTGLSEDEVFRRSYSLRFAHSHPELYLKLLGHLLVMSELVALLTPAIAMGIQWVTALCPGPPVLAILELLSLCFGCVVNGHCSFSEQHCILK